MTTLATLQADVRTWTRRNPKSDEMATLLTMTEAHIATRVRVRAMRATDDSFVIASRRVALPERFLSIIRFRLNQTDGNLRFLPPDLFYDDQSYFEQGVPSVYTIEGEEFVFSPEPAVSYTGLLSYYRRFSSLVDADDTNWLLTNHYPVYMHTAIAQAFALFRDNEEAAKHLATAQAAIDRLNTSDQYSAIQGNALTRAGVIGP